MTSNNRYRSRRVFAGCGLLLLALFQADAQRVTGGPAAVPELLSAAVARPSISSWDESAYALHRSDPLAYLRQARSAYENRVRDFMCRFSKQELIGDRLSKRQVADVKFREGPFSVYMHVVENAGRYRRVLFVKDRIVKNGQQHAVIEPEGAIARFLVRSVSRPVDGSDARKSSRRVITEFGFGRSLDLILRYADFAAELGRLDLRFVGEGEVDGRPTYRFERRSPIDDQRVEWADALLVFEIDQEWGLPVACFSYADLQGTKLLGEYVYTDVQLNVGLTDLDFHSKSYGL